MDPTRRCPCSLSFVMPAARARRPVRAAHSPHDSTTRPARGIPHSLLPRVVAGVPSRLGGGARYGLGVIVRPTPLGTSWGHSGFFPGYATEMAYLPASRIAVAVQVNVTDPYPRGLAP